MSKKIIIATSAFTIGIILFVVFVIVPLFKGITRDSKNLEAQYLEVFKASSAENEGAEFLKFSQEHQQDLERIESVFVDAETPVGFIEFLEEIAASSNLELKITPGNSKKEEGAPWPVMGFQLASSASYPDFVRFLEKLENGPHLLFLKNTSLTRERSPAAEENIEEDISFTMFVEVFTGPLPKTATP
ncbi:MAG: hypothetical protein A3D64_01940 [Candidatus Wildermuthbacteria bacterium RIFCSPHIGHO2_02_FULL_49_9]|uniref:Uncharacterized protein n=2 Tax=Candidatus Wildermuthiibacteriota TaxID=1817923 RepID=A0A1G2R0I3_9BACT|nr:MAG: hypothetical protein A2672_01225 [Candidatus Wildermuthbacteria bacterium RIFCSPHIGHO2_01_FULL_49_22b]OHA70951.1 MAG: hypothetical protein A3D64_01940 [Candidatus Wildermuthbacteria bacterium RIFCSPHIGHO2_02_FULL_49_9]